MIYLDANASAPLRPGAVDAMARAMKAAGNPSSVHGPGRAQRRTVDEAREAVAAMVGASPERVVFTASGTEANNLALRGIGARAVLASAVEHVSVLDATDNVRRVPVTGEGILDLDALAAMLAGGAAPTLVSVMLANNETGAIQPVARAAEIAHAHGALLHCDAAQAAGRIAIDMAALGADMLTLSAHKMGGPMGTGALVLAGDLDLDPILRGGGQERRRRAGSENVPAVAGFGAVAADVAALLAEAPRLAELRDGLETRLLAEAPDAVVFGTGVPRLPNTSCVAMPGASAETQVIALDLAGIAVSAGAACSSGKVAPSHVLAAMGVPETLARNAIRVSLGWHNTAAETVAFARAWLGLHARFAAPRAA